MKTLRAMGGWLLGFAAIMTAGAGGSELHAQNGGVLSKANATLAVDASVVLSKFQYGGMLGSSKIETWLHGVTVLPNGEIWLEAGSALHLTAPQQVPPGSYLVRFDIYTTNPYLAIDAGWHCAPGALLLCRAARDRYLQACEVSLQVTSGAFDVWLELTGPAAVSSLVSQVTVTRFRELQRRP